MALCPLSVQDMGTSTDKEPPEARVGWNYLDLTVKSFLLAMNWLYHYDMDEELAASMQKFKHCALA